MLTSPIEAGESLRIGTVEEVKPEQILVQLDLHAPYDVAAGEGRMPLRFPRINDYVLIPYGGGNVVAQIAWIGIKEDTSPSHQQLRQDPSLLDLPFPTRKMGVNPLGVLRKDRDGAKRDAGKGNKSKSAKNQDEEKPLYKLERGLNTYPSVGEAVLLPTDDQLRGIVESSKKRVLIGVNPQAANADVWVDPDKLFGRHLAVLGNTGSGKSCSVAGLIRWSLEEAEKKVAETAKRTNRDQNINARFIILDPSGEYAKAFRDRGAWIFQVSENPGESQSNGVAGDKNQYKQLRVPLWFWNLEEWINFTQPSQKTQLPFLKEVLTEVKKHKTQEDHLTPFSITEFRCYLSELAEREGWNIKRLLKRIKNEVSERIRGKKELLPDQKYTEEECLQYFDEVLQQELNNHKNKKKDSKKKENVSPLVTRIEIMLEKLRNNKLITDGDKNINLAGWLKDHLGGDQPDDKHIRIIDLSLVPSEFIHIAMTVFSRMILEALQRYRKEELSESEDENDKGKTLPTVLVLDEAHHFVGAYRSRSKDEEDGSPEEACRNIFEKIAREGRKYGLGLVIASQRPSELSQTILSQCNTFLLHRIVNDRDQDLMRRLVPDNLQDLFGTLPALPTRQAILTGWATELPTRIEMRKLESEQLPKSEDPDLWDVWTGGEKGDVKRPVYWEPIADRWLGK